MRSLYFVSCEVISLLVNCKLFVQKGQFPDGDTKEDGYHGVAPVTAYPPQNNYGNYVLLQFRVCHMLSTTIYVIRSWRQSYLGKNLPKCSKVWGWNIFSKMRRATFMK